MARNFLLALAVAAASSEALFLRADPNVVAAEGVVDEKNDKAEEATVAKTDEVTGAKTEEADAAKTEAPAEEKKEEVKEVSLAGRSALGIKFVTSMVGQKVTALPPFKKFAMTHDEAEKALKATAKANKTSEENIWNLKEMKTLIALAAEQERKATKAPSQSPRLLRKPDASALKPAKQDGESAQTLNAEEADAGQKMYENMKEQGLDAQAAKDAANNVIEKVMEDATIKPEEKAAALQVAALSADPKEEEMKEENTNSEMSEPN